MPNLLSHMSHSKNQSNQKKLADHIASRVDNTKTVSDISLCSIFIHCFLGSSVQRMLTAQCHWCQFLLVWLGSVKATRRQLYTHIYNASTKYNELVYTIYSLYTFIVHGTCMNWMHEIRVKYTNIKMSLPKSQNKLRWLMSHRLCAPAIGQPW